MYELLLVPGFAANVGAAARREAAAVLASAAEALPETRGTLFAPTLPGVYNGGDHLLRLSFADAAACDAALASAAWRDAGALLEDRAIFASVERAGYEGGLAGGPSGGAGLYRVALFCANVRPDAERLAAFAAETAAMPRSIRTIRRWCLSRTRTGEGARPWTHVWEQEYADLAGLNGAYMLHPAHWARVERWFDPEYPEHLVDPVLVHSFCAIDRPAIAAA